jgi:hypothetical protein|tara:strand:+ start:14 stop:784 length:771 start_codon:yes stop_codon:yes gene_type:complete
MAIVFDAQGNLVDTEGRIDFLNTGTEQVFPNQDFNQYMPEQTSKAQLESALGAGFYPERGINTLRFVDNNSMFLQPNYLLPNTNKVPQLPANRLEGLDLNRFEGIGTLGIANEEDVEQEFLPGQKKSGGIADLFKTLIGFAIPGANFFLNKGRDALGGIRSLNQRLRNTDFGRSKNLMDYLDMKKYGGYQGREDARAATMAQARGIQKKIDRGDYGTASAQDKTRGSIPSRSSPTTSRKDTSPSSSYSQASYGRRR